jgi:HTH-like domain
MQSSLSPPFKANIPCSGEVLRRRFCRHLRSSESLRHTDEDQLTQAILALAGKYGRYGYRRITVLLRNAGWQVGKDRVQRIWRREGISANKCVAQPLTIKGAMPKNKFPRPLPSATTIGAHINEFVAWDGETYVLRPTKESVLADEGLKLIGSVRELSRIRRFSPGYVFVQDPSQEALCPDCALQDIPAPEPPLAFTESALNKLNKLFAGALGDAKVESCCAAWSGIKVAKTAKNKVEILNEKARQWREGSVNAIRHCFPQFVKLAEAYDEALQDDALRWATDRVWEMVEKQCGIRRPNPHEAIRHDSISRTMVFWFAMASEGNSEVNGPPPRPWKTPGWLARSDEQRDSLLREHTGHLCLRLNHVINEEMDAAEIRSAISHRDRLDGPTPPGTNLVPDTVGAPVNPQPALREGALIISFGRIFSSKTSESYQTWLEVNRQLEGVHANDPASGAFFARKHAVFRSGLNTWLDSLVDVVLSEVDTLSRIGASRPYLRGDADPAEWARLHIQGLLRESLRQEISAVALENAFQKGSSLLDSGDHPPPKSSAPAIEIWFRMACEGIRDLPAMEPWCAPYWCYQSFSVPLWTRRGQPSHLTKEHTEKELRSAQRLFAGRLENALEVAGDRARVFLASGHKPTYEVRHQTTNDDAIEKEADNAIFDASLGTGATGLRYRSELKRVIQLRLAQNPRATDLDICRALDADGGAEMPLTWTKGTGNRMFEDVYKDPDRRNNVHTYIGKIRLDMRKKRLLP